jgi:hypothetical protein
VVRAEPGLLSEQVQEGHSSGCVELLPRSGLGFRNSSKDENTAPLRLPPDHSPAPGERGLWSARSRGCFRNRCRKGIHREE